MIIGIFAFPSSSHALSKSEAFLQLQKSDKWKLTESLVPDAKEKIIETESQTRPHVSLGLRQFVARTNPIQYGDSGKSISTILFGTTALQTSWTILDPLTQAELLLLRSKVHSSVDQSHHYQLDLTAGLAIQYLTAQKLKKIFEHSQSNLERSELVLKYAETKNKVGAGIPLDIARAKNLVNLERLKKMSNYAKYLRSKHDLAQTIGVDKIDSDLDVIAAKIIQFDNYQQVLSQALASRPDLKSAQDALSSAQLAQVESSKKVFPKLTLLGEFGTTDSSLLGLPGNTVNGFLGVSLTIPFDSGGYIEAKRFESRMLLTKTGIALREKVREVTSQIKEALENLTLAEESLKASQDYAKTAGDEYQLTSKRYYAGSGNGLDYTTAHSNLTAAQDNLTEAIFNYEAAKISYYRSIGNFRDYFE